MRKVLERLDIDGEAERVRRWLDLGLGPAPALRRELQLAQTRLRLRGPESAPGRARALISLGRHAEGLELLRRLERPSPEDLLWRAEAALRLDLKNEAASDLGRALAERPKDPKALCLAAVARYRSSDPGPSLRLLARVAARGDAVAVGLSGVFFALAGDAARASRRFEETAKLRPRAAWPLALRAFCPGADAPAAVAALSEAIRRAPDSAWLYALRSQSLERATRMEAAISDAGRALALGLPSPAVRAQRAHLLFYRKRYGLAASDFSQALRLAPGNPRLWWQRAMARWLAGDIDGARADAARSARLAPADPEFQLAAARADVFLDDGKRARKAVRGWLASKDRILHASGRFLLGALEFRARRYRAAAREYALAEELVRSGRTAKFGGWGHAQLARAFEWMQRREAMMSKTMRRRKRMAGPGRAPTLILAGLGLDYPRQATLEVLQALGRCDVVFNNLAGAEAMEFLALFCKDVRTVSYEGHDEPRWIKKVFGALGPGRTAAFVTRGHPLVSGALANGLLREAKRRKVRTLCYGAVSTIDHILALSEQALAETHWGLQVLDARLIVDGAVSVQSQLPAIVYVGVVLGEGLARRNRSLINGLGKALAGPYPVDHQVFLFGPRYDSRELEPVALAGLAERLLREAPDMLSSMILYLPPARAVVPGDFRPARPSR